ncbi:uncharacterized protein LOC117123540 [Anneissia japonica]|uniref:uncharacterized protein LOC117123540 n=1 Tax=Anneissia japonica TaxID=1529436 RepID=UPI001425AEBB|nr:uncharacterized protein LOC117123540 [Anneissia japonica]
MATKVSLPYHCPKCGGSLEFQNLISLRKHLTNDHTFSDFFDSSPSHEPRLMGKRSLNTNSFIKVDARPSSAPSSLRLPQFQKTETYVPNLLEKLSNTAKELEQQLLLAQRLGYKKSKQSVGFQQFDSSYTHSADDVYRIPRSRTFTPDDLISGTSKPFDVSLKERPKSSSGSGLGEHYIREEVDALILSTTLRKMQSELELKDEELRRSKEELAKVLLEKLQLDENSMTLAGELDAKKEMVSHLKTEIEDREQVIQQKERNLKEMNDFLARTSEKQAAAKEQLRVFMDNVLDRAEQAENELHTLRSTRNTPVGYMMMPPSEASSPVNGSQNISMSIRHRKQMSSSSNEVPSTHNQTFNSTQEHARHPLYDDSHQWQRSSGRLPTSGRTSAPSRLRSDILPMTKAPDKYSLYTGRTPSQEIAKKNGSSVNSGLASMPDHRRKLNPGSQHQNGDEIHHAVNDPSPFYYSLERSDSPSSPRSHLIRNQERHMDLYPDSAIGSSGNGSRIVNSEFAILSQAIPHMSNSSQYSKPEVPTTIGRSSPATSAKRYLRHNSVQEAPVIRESTENELQERPHINLEENAEDSSFAGDYEGRLVDERGGHHLSMTTHESNHVDALTDTASSLRNGSAITQEDHMDLELFRNAVEHVLHQRDLQSRTSLYSSPGFESRSPYTNAPSSQIDSDSEGQSSGYDDSSDVDGSLDELPVKDQSSGFKDCPKQRKIGLYCVFSYLDTDSLLACAQVSKEWNQVARHPALWKKVHLSRHTISSKFLQTISKWCTQMEHLTLQSLRPRPFRKGEKREDYLRKTRGMLEAGLEYLLQASGSSLLTLKIYDCCNILTDRSLWLASCHCRFLQTVMYVSDTDPIGHEVIWALGAGCRNICALQIPPMFPCKNAQKFNNKCLQMVGRCWPLLQGLCIGGMEIDVKGLVSVVKNCPRLHVLELDHMLEVTEEVAIAMCSHGLRGLETLIFTATPATPKAILHFNGVCPQLKVIAVYVGISDYFDDITNKENQREFKNIASALKVLKKKPALMDILHLKTNCN